MTPKRWNPRMAVAMAVGIVAVSATAIGGCARSHQPAATTGAIAAPTKARPVPPEIQREFANALKQYNEPHPPHHESTVR